MGLSRLDNFLKSSKGTILYVNPNDLDSTDSIENRGNSLTRPFKSIQRALVESARFSYQRGLNNDRFGKTTILLYPGEHYIDNRPGYIPNGQDNYLTRSGSSTSDLPEYELNTNFDVQSVTNELYKLNSIYGGVIVPRGTSIVGLDLRKTKVRPLYVPDPINDNIERTSIFRITGACYFWQFSMFDGNPNGAVYKDYTSNTSVPNFSHHKLTCFEYADGVNNVAISDQFIPNFTTDRTDLDMYYEKVSIVYGQSSGRVIAPDYPSANIDIQKKIDEYRIVGATGGEVGISSIRAGDGVTSSTIITVTATGDVDGLEVDTPFRIQGITASGYNGQYVVSSKIDDRNITFNAPTIPPDPLPSVFGSTLTLSNDTVTSASPYIFNTSLRSVFGMNGMHADGAKATGFRSMVVAQFTGIGLQKDDRAFVLFNQNSPSTGLYDSSNSAGNETLSNNSRAIHKPEWRNFHIRVSNNSVIQSVSCFAIGYAEQFITDSGGDISLTNSNSNFGAVALVSEGFRPAAFPQDNQGYITHVIPPKNINLDEKSIEFLSIDVLKTLPQSLSSVGVGSTGRLYLYEQTNEQTPPAHILQGYRIGARDNDTLNFLHGNGSSTLENYSARITMPVSQTFLSYQDQDHNITGEKSYRVGRSVSGISSIGPTSVGGNINVISLEKNHSFINGESVRVVSENAHLPDGLVPNSIYHAITSSTGITTTQNIKLAKTKTDALNDIGISFNNKGGQLRVISRVSDKEPNEEGHPIQYDTANSQWYINVSTASTQNAIFGNIVGLGSTSLGPATPRTFITRKSDIRNTFDRLYHVRYTIPRNSGTNARPPIDGYILQESSTGIGATDSEIQTYYNDGSLTNETQQKSFKFIADASWNGLNTVTIDTELPHHLTLGSQVNLRNITSTVNPDGTENLGFNRSYEVTGISSAKQFNVGLSTDPGLFTNTTNIRNINLPYFFRQDYAKNFFVYRISELQRYTEGEQDGVYYLTLVGASIEPTVSPFIGQKFSQPVDKLYPQLDRDNPNSDPDEAISHARSSLIGKVDVSDSNHSITKKSNINFSIENNSLTINEIESSDTNTHVITTNVEHQLNPLLKVQIVDPGTNYGVLSGSDEIYYNARITGIGASISGKTATARVTVGLGGTIADVKIIDGGCGFEFGNELTIAGIATSPSFSRATLRANIVRNDIGKSLRISGVTSEGNKAYNNIYRVTDVQSGAARSFTVSSASSIFGFTPNGITGDVLNEAEVYYTGESVDVLSYTYNQTTGIATVSTDGPHGFDVGRCVYIGGATNDRYNGFFDIIENFDNLSIPTYGFSIKVGVGTTTPPAGSNIVAYPKGYGSNAGALDLAQENIRGRMAGYYAGISTTLSAPIQNLTDTLIYLRNIDEFDVTIGDYLQIENEIVRVRDTVNTSSVLNYPNSTTSNQSISVFRGVLGTRAETHLGNTLVQRIKPIPVEFRRHSIIRASGHTFEYVGYGPGNYSTAFPDRQDRQITPEQELIAQSTKRAGGINFYTGMNDKGISYSGNKKLSTITGTEEIFDTPIQTITGEDISQSARLNVLNPLEGVFDRSIRVDGGVSGEAISEFTGPLIVNNKVVVNSPKGVETDNLFLQGDATVSRKYTVGLGTPSLAGNPGDIVYNANPVPGGSAGWIYTLTNNWKSFGTISLERDTKEDIFERVGIATTTAGDKRLMVYGGTREVSIDDDGRVGVGTSASPYKVHVIGDSNLVGDINVSGASTVGNRFEVLAGGVNVSGTSTITGVGIVSETAGLHAGAGVSIYAVGAGQTIYYYGDGQNLVNLNADQIGWIRQGNNLAFEDVLNGSVGIGTSIPTGGVASDYLLGYSLTVGSAIPGLGGTSAHFHDGIHVTGQARVDLGVNVTAGISSIMGPYAFENNTKGNIVGTAATFRDKFDVSAGFSTFREVFISGVTTHTNHTYHHAFSEANGTATINTSNGELTLDLSTGQNFEATVNQQINKIILTNAPANASSMSFTLKLTQNNSANYFVDIDDFEFNTNPVPVYWPGGVVPVISRANGKTDIYNFKTFNTASIDTAGLYGIVGGQNFS